MYCYTYGLLHAERGITVPRNSLTRCTARHLRFRRLVQFIFAGPVSNNALKNCAALLCRTCADSPICVAVRYLTLRTGYERHGRKNPLPFPFSERLHIGHLRQTFQGKGRSSKRKENRRLSFLFAPAAGAATLPPSADGESPPAEVQRKTFRPLGANTLTQFEYPAQPVQKRSRPSGANTPAAVRVPQLVGAGNIYKKELLRNATALSSVNLNRTGSKPKFPRRYVRSPR